jgi:hypothetical protein
MKEIGYILGFGTLYLAAAFTIFNQNSELSRLKTENILIKSQLEIMRDENTDLFRTISSARTYEDGVRDGIENAENISYVSGYHAAIAQNNCADAQHLKVTTNE